MTASIFFGVCHSTLILLLFVQMLDHYYVQ